MQDDNLEHMEYLLTKEAVADWFLSLSYNDIHRLFSINKNNDAKQLYLKQHGLPVYSEIKE